MNIPDIINLRKEGRIEEAYTECKTLLNSIPDDRHARIEMSYIIHNMTEACAKVGDDARYIPLLKEFADLRVWEVGAINAPNSIAWSILQLFKNVREQSRLAAIANNVFDIIKDIKFVHPQKYYSILLSAFLRVKGALNTPWMRFDEFMDWWGFENLMEEDFKAINIAQGRSIPSLAERAHSTYYKILAAKMEKGIADQQKIEAFLVKLDELQQTHPEYQYTLYHKALLLLALGRKEDALEALRPFVRRKQSEFWVWDVLAETTDDDEIKLSCLCRALQCNANPEFLGKVRIKAATEMAKIEAYPNAKCEIEQVVELYEKKGWRMPQEVNTIKASPWYHTTERATSNREFYEAHLEESENFLFIDNPEVAILVTYYNREKRICNFITQDRKRGFFSTRRLRCNFAANQIYKVRFAEEIDPAQRSTVVSCKRENDVQQYVNIFFKKISGTINIREDKGFGFVDGIFVDANLVAASNLSSGDYVTGTAVLSYNKRRETFDWKAIKLRHQ